MIFYEATSFGLRVVTFQFVNKDNKNIKIRLLPMVHIGSEKYYKEVEKYLEDCDRILFEGNGFKSWKIKMRNNEKTARKLNLVTQKELNLKQYKDKLIHADFNQESGKEAWKNLTIIDKIKYNIVFPIWTYFQDKNITRSKFVKYFMKSVEDLDLIYGPYMDEKERIKGFVDDSREKKVFEELDKIHKEKFDEEIQIAIVYGAGHMKAISNYMMHKLNYKSKEADFIEVFKI